MFRVVLLFVGGGTGTLLRYSMQGWLSRGLMSTFPLGTLVVNVLGCFLIGFLGGMFFGPRPIGDDYRFGILTGILGGFTTFSTFGWETMQLTSDREFLAASANVILSVGVGLAAVWFGKQIVQMLYSIS